MKVWGVVLLVLWAASVEALPRVRHRTHQGGNVHEVTLPDGSTYGIVIYKNGQTREIRNGQLGRWGKATYPKDGPPQVLRDVAADVGQASLPPIPPTGGTLDVGVAVSPEQVTIWGGWNNTLGHLAIAEDLSNETLARSVHPLARVKIIVAEPWVLTEANCADFSGCWSQWQYNSTAQQQIARFKAAGVDIPMLIVTYQQYCGLGTFGPTNTGLRIQVAGVCLEANMSFLHELGHCAGAGHNIGDSAANGTLGVVCDPTYQPGANPAPIYPNAPYGVGWQDPNGKFRTVMSYGGSPRTRQLAAPPPTVWYGDNVTLVGNANNGRPTAEAGCIAQGWMTLVNKTLPVSTRKPLKTPMIGVTP